MAFFTSVLLLATLNLAVATSQASSSEGVQGRSLGLAPLETIYGNLVSSSQVLKVILVNLSHLLFNTVGWYLTATVWSAIRGDAVSSDPDIQGTITNGLLDGEFAGTNLAIGAGSLTFAYLAWSALIMLLGSATGTGKRSIQVSQEGVWLRDEGSQRQWGEAGWTDSMENVVDNLPISPLSAFTRHPQERTLPQIEFTEAALLTTLDEVFAFPATSKQFVINSMNTIGAFSFMTFMSYLPEPNSGKRSLDEL